MVTFKKISDLYLKNLSIKDKPYRVACGRGLNLLIKPTGTKYWIYRYRYAGKENNLSLGRYPDITLIEAENEVVSLYRKLKSGINPSDERKQERALLKGENYFRFDLIAKEMAEYHFKHLSQHYKERSMMRFNKHIFPWLGNKDVRHIKAKDIIERLRAIEDQNLGDTVKKVRILINQTFRYAQLTDRCTTNPCEGLRGIIKHPKPNHMPAFTDEKDVAELLRAMDGFKGSYPVLCALKLAPHFFVRPGELRSAKWKDIDFENHEWRYLVNKTQTEHLVPLTKQTETILSDLKKVTGDFEYVFPNGNDINKPMSDAAINAALRRLGYNTKSEITGHGFRAMARTILHEKLNFDPIIIEHQLAHQVPDNLGQAYNRTKFLEQRKDMMQVWSDHLDHLKNPH